MMLEQDLDPNGCALVIVDVQNDFCHPEGALGQTGQTLAPVQASLPNIHRIISAAREINVPRVFLRAAHGHWTDTGSWVRRGSTGTSMDVEGIPVAREGTWGAEFFEVEPRADELIITKHRYSGFAYTPLELALQAKRCGSLVLVGTATNVCVEATARDGIMRGFYPIVVRDCVSTGQSWLHDAAIADMREYLGAVVELKDVLSIWGREGKQSSNLSRTDPQAGVL